MIRKITRFLIRLIVRLPLIGFYGAGADEPLLAILIFLSPLIALGLALHWAGSQPAGSQRSLAYFMVITGAVGLILLLVGLNIWAKSDSDDQRRASWREFANLMGLTFDKAAVKGIYRGREAVLIAIDADDARYQLTSLELKTTNPSGGRMHLRRRSRISSSGTLIGDEAFDKAFYVRTSPDDFALRVLASEESRRRITELVQYSLSKVPKIEIRQGTALFQRSGIEMNIGYLRSMLDLLSDLADSAESIS